MKHRWTQNLEDVSRSRILTLLDDHDAPEVAQILGLNLKDVLAVARSAPKPWLLRCNKTDREWRHRTERLCYRWAQILGLTDYDFGRVA